MSKKIYPMNQKRMKNIMSKASKLPFFCIWCEFFKFSFGNFAANGTHFRQEIFQIIEFFLWELVLFILMTFIMLVNSIRAFRTFYVYSPAVFTSKPDDYRSILVVDKKHRVTPLGSFGSFFLVWWHIKIIVFRSQACCDVCSAEYEHCKHRHWPHAHNARGADASNLLNNEQLVSAKY